MDNFYKKREEIKYIIDNQQFKRIVIDMSRYLQTDSYAQDDCFYYIVSSYILTWTSKTREYKNHGHLRLRKYISKRSTDMYIEEKIKAHNERFKKRYRLINGEYEKLLKLNSISSILDFIEEKKFVFSNPLLIHSEMICHSISYKRFPYHFVWNRKELRLTFDLDVMCNEICLIPNKIIMEIKGEDLDSALTLFLKEYMLKPSFISKYRLISNYLKSK